MKKSISLLFAGAALIAGLSSCAQNVIPKNERPQGPSLSGINSRDAGNSETSKDLAVMNGRERKHYFALDNDHDRRRFLLSNGIITRRVMEQKLEKGMSKDAVKAALDGHFDAEVPTPGESERLLFTAFNGRSTTHMYCVFASDDSDFALERWGSYTDEQHDRESVYANIEASILNRLNRWLKPGMGREQILGTHRDAAKLRRSLVDGAHESIREADNQSSTALGNEVIADRGMGTDIWKLDGMVSFFDGLSAEPKYSLDQGDMQYWYYTVPVENSDGFVVVEYRFQNRELVKWYVYHTDFIGFLDHK